MSECFMPPLATGLKACCCSQILAFEVPATRLRGKWGFKAELITNINVYKQNKYFSGSGRIVSRGVNKGFVPSVRPFPMMKDGVRGGTRRGPARPDGGTEVKLTHIDLFGCTTTFHIIKNISTW